LGIRMTAQIARQITELSFIAIASYLVLSAIISAQTVSMGDF